ncbi:symmetrical bis(5'-nucleosyl)-tetraphosphatase [Rhodopseudomonas palustris]|uniref:Bis(5'-nucleosyl)-tetraphosphatase, symmetrical n=1 Tax=Thiospirillum jenense TaxID=1653858 RepID=A0A839HFP2_9GAMM|nr:symmetrical bis(5'-nucleosyl)-tetraphosphatase [Thiospirillum jenense]MBB1093759.1 symmetrical bis(5'-nucleosyl)-tetraphosphatase [Rhodopseudomonas palustris]MBB1127234.1 symmetrical bis(5'-nucleosyl)-tetraphosphatase [Thiospirillum jenense]
MATYAIGDVQGCYDELRALLDRLEFDPEHDVLWCVGDLVNRGPNSLAVLRFFKALGEQAQVVLGNHDLHLLALAAGNDHHREKDGLHDVLTAPDRDELLNWLRHRPLLFTDVRKQFTLVHAGLAPQWDLAQAHSCANEVEQVLRDPDNYQAFLCALYGNEPQQWHDDLQGMDRLRFIVNCLTRLRYCTANGKLLLKEKGPLGSQSSQALPWFRVPQRGTQHDRIIFGHWSTLGYLAENNVWALDSGCLWGGQLTAVRVRRKKRIRVTQIDCVSHLIPDTHHSE